VSKNNNIIEINGKRYDAHTGAALDEPAVQAAHKAAAHTATPKPVTPKAKPTARDVVRAKPKHAAAHKPQPAKTLMRSAVKKPSGSFKRHVKAQSNTGALIKQPSAAVIAKASINRVDEKRLKSAEKIPKSKLVKHFNEQGAATYQPLVATTITSEPFVPPVVAPTTNTTEDVLQRALERASSHRESQPKRHSKNNKLARVSGVSLATLSFVLLAGLAIQNNLPGAKLHLASSQAGFAASLPSYKPAGYSLQGIESGPGVVAIHYQSNSDERTYTLTEKDSAWDSTSLRDQFVASTGQSYNTIESGGRTIFIYGQHDATWVSGGVWYQVHTAGALSDRQLIDLASSL
jgi:hypothetical protein